MKLKRLFLPLWALLLSGMTSHADEIKGRVVDKTSSEPLIGATVQIVSENKAAICDIDGFFRIDGLAKGRYALLVKYVTYEDLRMEDVPTAVDNTDEGILIGMTGLSEQLGSSSVVATRVTNTELSAISMFKESEVVMSNISSQEIKRTQDTNASEVIRRIPGVSIIDDKFVMVRGLSQRYNNVWMNGGAVPSSEADSRAFSFDIIPSSQIDNISIIKSSSPEYPADFSGGFISIRTKDVPDKDFLTLTMGGNMNDGSAMKDFISKNADDWLTRRHRPLGDVKGSAEWALRRNLGLNRLGIFGALTFSNEYRTYAGMTNNLYGLYDKESDTSIYLRHSTDDQYNRNERFGALLNMTILTPGGSRLEWKNLFNRIVNDRYTWREGISAQNDIENSAEYYTRNRNSYSTQLTGSHGIGRSGIDWSAGYSYADRHMPDRRRYLVSDALNSDHVLELAASNDINIENTLLREHIASLSLNEKLDLSVRDFSPVLKAGLYGEFRTRTYVTRDQLFNWDPRNNDLPAGFQRMDIPELLSDPSYRGPGRLTLLEYPQLSNNYDGNDVLAAGYVAASVPIGRLDIYAGVRYEYNIMELISNLSDHEVRKSSKYTTDSDFFPSVNMTYRIDRVHQLRLSYGRSINRSEFREVSSSVYYDFDLASDVQGNPDLKSCHIDNADFRYEIYPSAGEVVSMALFYKHFKDPIEWTYTVAGGTDLVYSYMNARRADSYGLELEVRKSLYFIELENLSWSFNGAVIKSKVTFEESSLNQDRPMQGQSPYLVNTGLFYSNPRLGLSASVLYNRIGRRIIGVGRSEGTTGDGQNARIPDSYEMPRNLLDLSVAQTIGKHAELRLYVRDVLSEMVTYTQFAENSRKETVEEITRQYRPGRNYGLQFTYRF